MCFSLDMQEKRPYTCCRMSLAEPNQARLMRQPLHKDVQNLIRKEEVGMTKQKVLVIEDEENVSELISLYFDKAGYEVITAVDGADGIEKARQYRPDIIILDLMLPGMDGLDVCKEIRKSSNIPIIMLTARVDEVDRVLGLEIGADDYITKPFSPRELLARVKAVLRRAAYVPSPDEQQVLNLPGLAVQLTNRAGGGVFVASRRSVAEVSVEQEKGNR